MNTESRQAIRILSWQRSRPDGVYFVTFTNLVGRADRGMTFEDTGTGEHWVVESMAVSNSRKIRADLRGMLVRATRNGATPSAGEWILAALSS